MLLFMVFAFGFLWIHPLRTFPAWRAGIARPGVSLATLVFFVALFSHMWVGLRDVLLDYARPEGLRSVLLVAVATGLLGMAVWVVHVLVLLQR